MQTGTDKLLPYIIFLSKIYHKTTLSWCCKCCFIPSQVFTAAIFLTSDEKEDYCCLHLIDKRVLRIRSKRMSPIIYFSQWAWHCNKKHDLNVCEKAQDTIVYFQLWKEWEFLIHRMNRHILLHFMTLQFLLMLFEIKLSDHMPIWTS